MEISDGELYLVHIHIYWKTWRWRNWLQWRYHGWVAILVVGGGTGGSVGV